MFADYGTTELQFQIFAIQKNFRYKVHKLIDKMSSCINDVLLTFVIIFTINAFSKVHYYYS